MFAKNAQISTWEGSKMMQNTAGPCIIQRIENLLQQKVKKLKIIWRKNLEDYLIIIKP